jgi:hypothetical protein
MGLPFPAAAFAAVIMSRDRMAMIPLGVLAASIPGFLMGPQAGVMSVVSASVMALCVRFRLDTHRTMAAAAAATVLAAALPVDSYPVFMGMDAADLAPLAQVYTDMGVEPETAREVFSTMAYLAPGIGAIQISLGSVAAVMLLSRLSGGRPIPSGKYMLGWQTAWVPIACLAARVLPAGLPAWALRSADNVLLFIALPYLIEGWAVARKWASSFPGMTVVLLAALFLVTPVVLAAVILTGVLDTWFDFRKKLENRLEGLNR